MAPFVPPVIDPPNQVDIRDVTDTTALVTWLAPVAEVEELTVSYGPTSNPSDRNLVELPSTESQYHLGGLEPDTHYQVSLTARKGDGTSKPVHQSFLTGSANIRGRLGAPWLLLTSTCLDLSELDPPRSLKTAEITDGSITLAWENSRAQVDSYRIKYGPLSGGEHRELLFSPGAKDRTHAKITGTHTHTHTHILGLLPLSGPKLNLFIAQKTHPTSVGRFHWFYESKSCEVD